MNPLRILPSFAVSLFAGTLLHPPAALAAEVPAGVWVRPGYALSVAVEGTTFLESASIDGKQTREVTTEVFFDQALYTRDTDRLLRAAPESTQKPIN